MIQREKVGKTLEMEQEAYVIHDRLPHPVWGAIFAGVVAILIVQFTLSLLGAAIGLGTVNPTQENENFRALGAGAAIWWIVSGLVALFCGGWVAGRLSGIPRRIDGLLHGLLAFGTSTLLLILFLTTSVGIFLGGAFNFLKQGGQTAMSSGTAMTATLNTLRQQSPEVAGTIDEIRSEVSQILQNRGTQPQAAAMEAQIMAGVGAVAIAPGDQEAQIQPLVTILTTNTNLSNEEAESTVNRWVQNIREVRPEVQQGIENVSERVSNVGTTAAWASFFMLVLGGAAAAWGGFAGTPHRFEKEMA